MKEKITRVKPNCSKEGDFDFDSEEEEEEEEDIKLHDWKEDYTWQSQPPARRAPLGKQRLVV
jgi:hypothetical protein